MTSSSAGMKIALVLDDSLDTPDGVQQYVLTLGRWLSAHGHEVHYLVGQTARTDLPALHALTRNLKTRFNGNRMSIPLLASKQRLRRLLREQQFDIIHVQTPYSPLLAGRIIRLVDLVDKRTAVVGSFHILPYTRRVAWANHVLAGLNRRTARRFDTMLANSEPSAEFARKVYKFRPIVLPNPFPLADFLVKPPQGTPLTIIFLGRLVARKGAMQLLMAVAYLRKQHLSDTPFRVIVGGRGELRRDLETYVAQQRLNSIITFAGFVAEADKAAFLAQADLAVFPSISGESFGISLLEGMAAARGVVLAGDNPGYRAVLGPLSTDQLVNPRDTASFAQALARWLDDSPARNTAAAAQKDYVAQFDIDVVGPKLVKVYEQALRSRRNMR